MGVQEGAQAAELGVRKGWRVRSIGGEALETTKGLVAKLKSLKSSGLSSAALAFSPPPLAASFDQRPFGFSVTCERSLGLAIVGEVSGIAEAQGIRAGAILTMVNGQEVTKL